VASGAGAHHFASVLNVNPYIEQVFTQTKPLLSVGNGHALRRKIGVG
jgi:hypothetical protein